MTFQIVQDWLKERQFDPAELKLDNGSGLSRESRISAKTLGEILRYAWQSPFMPEFLSSMSISGLDGTLARTDFARRSPKSATVDIRVDPPLENLRVENKLKIVPGRCRGYQRGITITPNQAVDHMIMSGEFPSGCISYEMRRTALSHNQFAFGLFKSIWEESGGEFSGSFWNVIKPDHAEPFLVFDSWPLADVITKINKHSNNVMARQLLLTLGAEKFARICFLSQGNVLRLDLSMPDASTKADSEPPSDEPTAEQLILTEHDMKDLQRKNILAALGQTNWRVSGKDGAAELLGVRPTTLSDRIKSFGLRKPRRS